MNQIPGIEKHTELLRLITECEELLDTGKHTLASVDLRVMVEYFVQEYLKANPGCVGENLQANITNLSKAGIISKEESDLFHQSRKFGNKGAHLNKQKTSEAAAKAYFWMIQDYIPDFLKKFPQPGSAPIPKFEKQKKSNTPYYPAEYLEAIDYSKITPLPIDFQDVRKYSEFFVMADGKMYVDRVAMTQHFAQEARNLLDSRPDEGDAIYFPGIIQEYIGCGSIRATSFLSEDGSLEWHAYFIDGADILLDYALFCRKIVLPNCVRHIGKELSNAIFSKERAYTIVLPGTYDGCGAGGEGGAFEWLWQIYNSVTLVYEPNPDSNAVKVDNTVYSRDFLQLLAIFPGVKYSRLELDARTRYISSGAIYKLDAEELVIPEGVTKLWSNAISHSTIKRLVLPASIEEIFAEAVYDCPNLETVEIPCGIRDVSNIAFISCPRLAKIPCKTILANQTPLADNPGYEGPDDMEEYINWLKYVPINLGNNIYRGMRHYILPKWVTVGAKKFDMKEIDWIRLVEERKNIPQNKRTTSIDPVPAPPPKPVPPRKPVQPAKPAEPEPKRTPDLLDLYIKLGFLGKALYVILSLWLISKITSLIVPIAELLPSLVGLAFALAVLLGLIVLAFIVYFMLGTHVDARKELYKKEKKR